MRRVFGLGISLSAALLAASAVAGDSADGPVAGANKPAASLSIGTRRAVDEFVAAYANRNGARLTHATTDDFEVQYGLGRSGAYVSLDEDALVASWREADANPAERNANAGVAIYPTADAQVVFVTYRIPGDAGRERIAFLELRGDRVARAHDLIATSPQIH